MARRYQVRKAPPKPTEPPCEFCEGAYWRYNGQDSYACDRITKKRHVCQSDAAEERRLAIAEREQVLLATRMEQQRRDRRTTRIVHGLIAIVIAAGVVWWGYASWTRPQHVRPGTPATPAIFQPSPPSSSNGHVQYPPSSSATAQCVDGTYSYAANHQGACSWHGGVAVWYR